MTRKVGNNLIIEVQEPDECEFCHKQAELRPYGANGENICFDCAMKDKPTTQRKFAEVLHGKVQ